MKAADRSSTITLELKKESLLKARTSGAFLEPGEKTIFLMLCFFNKSVKICILLKEVVIERISSFFYY